MEAEKEISLIIVQEKTLEVMDYFAEFCRKHNLRYFIVGGTLLGAVRHKGFIPWDDDIDIAMPRKDYGRLLQLQNELDHPYQLRNSVTDPSVHFLFSKIENVETTKVEKANGEIFLGGIGIDIFPQDGLPDDMIKREKLIRKFEFYGLMRTYAGPVPMKTANQLVYKMLSKIIKICMSSRTYEQKLEQICTKYSYDDCATVRSFYGVYGAKETYRKDLHGDGCLLEFAGRQYTAPVQWDKYLTQMYGDYMTLPPVEKRVSPHDLEDISLDKSYRRQS